MNIWYISKYASPTKYFFGTRHFYLAEEWVKSGHTACVITSNSSHLSSNLPKFRQSKMQEDIEGVKTIWLNTFKSKASSSISRVISWFHFDIKLLFFDKRSLPIPDVIIISSLALTTIIPGWLLAKRYRSKFVFEVRDIWPLSPIVLGGYSKYHPFMLLLRSIEYFGYRKADLIVGTMPNLKQHIFNIMHAEYNNIVCIPQGVNLGFYNSLQEELPEDYLLTYLPRDKFIICYAGTININNPLDTFVKAAELLKNNSRIYFLVVGSGDQKEEWMRRTCNFPNISFAPSLKKSQVNALLKNVNICYDAFDSDLAQFGLSRNKWIDYMYAAKPILCSFEGYQSILNEAGCGEFVAFRDYKLLASRILHYSSLSHDRLFEIGMKGKAFLLENRSFDVLAKKYIQAIEEF